MPIFLIIGFSFLFSDDNKTLYKIGVLEETQAAAPVSLEFLTLKYAQVIPFTDHAQAINKITHHQIDILLDSASNTPGYWINSSSPNGYILEKLLLGMGGQQFEKHVLDGKEIRYVDWVLPGILALNIMFSCLFGVGYVIVRYRKSGFLKRLHATPISAMQFLLAQMVSRLLLIQAITVIVYVGCDMFIDFDMQGSLGTLFFIFTLGEICMISLGLIIAARITSEELAGGLLNMATWPMMLLSGAWFSMEGAHPWLQALSKALPLTHLIDAARAIMTEGATLAVVMPQAIILGVMTVVFMLIGSLIFRWN